MMINVLQQLHNYNHHMSVSQLVTFFERHGMHFTKTMIQHYLKIGLLSPPEGRRYDTQVHVIQLTWIGLLKEFYGLEDIRQMFLSVNYDPQRLTTLYENYLAGMAEVRDKLQQAVVQQAVVQQAATGEGETFTSLAYLALSKKIARDLLD